ncbi:hypothetical protein LJC07_06880 [Christensenellaceae bacterium OttesenSCG-928-L17]|nr:hypothetical protein [Christensenellaceae bacterium OttesenSCG-928-L17]
MNSERVLPFEKQMNDASCGAASLSMIYKHFGVPASQKDIWDFVKAQSPISGADYCKTHKMALHALEAGIPCTLISVKDPLKAIKLFLPLHLEIIILYHKGNDGIAHFSPVTSATKKTISVNDPAEDSGVNIQICNINARMASKYSMDEIVTPNIFLVFAPPKFTGEIRSAKCPNTRCNYIHPLIGLILPHVEQVICPKCDYVYSLTTDF